MWWLIGRNTQTTVDYVNSYHIWRRLWVINCDKFIQEKKLCHRLRSVECYHYNFHLLLENKKKNCGRLYGFSHNSTSSYESYELNINKKEKKKNEVCVFISFQLSSVYFEISTETEVYSTLFIYHNLLNKYLSF